MTDTNHGQAASGGVARQELLSHCDSLLDCGNWRDYAPNGLQVEGRPQVRRIVTGVTACQELLDAAVAAEADTVLVHHGYFWKNEPDVVVGMKRRRLATLLTHEINLIAYHLPLDGHPGLGNNAVLASELGLEVVEHFGHQSLAVAGILAEPTTVEGLANHLTKVLQRPPLVVGPTDRAIRRVGLCTGGAQDMIEEAANLGLDAFISGEISERTTHIAREAGITYYAAGHHATERGGVRALGDYLGRTFGIEVRFVDIENPV